MDPQWVGAIVGSVALIWGLGSFYWVHLRKGPIRVGQPPAFAASVGSDRTIVDVPLGFHNTGAVGRSIDNLALQLRQSGRSARLRFNATRASLGASEQQWARQIIVPPGASVSIVGSFQIKQAAEPWRFEAGTCECTMWAKLDGRNKWRTLGSFNLELAADQAERINCSGQFLPYERDPNDAPPP